MSQYRGPKALEFVYGLVHNYGELVIKLHGLFNVRNLSGDSDQRDE